MVQRHCIAVLGDRAVMHKLSFGSYEEKKKVYFVWMWYNKK